MLSKLSLTVSALLVISAVLGCGPGLPDGAQPTFPTTVKVNYKGQPVEGAVISFINEVAPAYGLTDATGVAVMKTYVDGDGAIAKIHNVTITKTNTTGEASDVDQDSDDYDPSDAYGTLKVEYLVPQKYASPVSSKLVADVKDTGPNEIVFDLKD